MSPRLPETPDVVMWQRNTTNGRIPRADLEELTPPQYDPDLQDHAVMYPPAARAMTDLLAAAKAAGHPVRVKYSYRTLAMQTAKYDSYLARNKAPPVVAVPGTSNHGEGLAVDLTDLSDADVTWLRNNAARFRFDNTDAPSEPWHWTYRGGYEREDDVTGDELLEGVKAYRRNQEPPEEGPARSIFLALKEAESKPEPRAPAEHTHRVNVTRRKTGPPLV